MVIVRLIEHLRSQEDVGRHTNMVRDAEAWPMSVREDNCRFCAYSSFCLQGVHIDLHHPPEGFSLQPFNPELQDDYDTTITEDGANAAG